MGAEKAIKYAIIVQWSLLVLALITGMIEESYLPDNMKWWLRRNESDEFSNWDAIRLLISLAFYTGYAIISAGVYFSKSWSRKPYAILSGITALVILMHNPSFTPVANTLEYCAYLAVGFNLALLYFSSLKFRFEYSTR